MMTAATEWQVQGSPLAVGPFCYGSLSVSVFWEAKISFSKELSYKKTIVQIFNVGPLLMKKKENPLQ